ncbi:uncharacterized protein LOC123297996 [Chrysoperla carnea]|uniref:uncharacterized protein LOC123297996 n=1 Tax=Chrysoperla carnea TaxID=189513 RepID=UPI001D08B28F|nr:uncharacterized protein LOC123297996 [Chrysoperla carnea]
MSKNSRLIFILLLYYVTQSKTNDVSLLNEQSEQPTHIDLLNLNDNHDLFITDNVDHQTNEHQHHHRRRHHHGEKLKYFNYCRYIRNEDCNNDKCCHIECAKANLEHNDQRKVCRHNCVQHCQNYLIDKYNVKIDVTEHPSPKDQGPGGIIEMINNTQDPNSITPDQALCCFIDVPENCKQISQHPFVQCEIKRKSTCGPQCLKKVVDINYQTGVIYQPTTPQILPSYQIIYNQPQLAYPNYNYYPLQPYYQYPYYQNSYYQDPYQNSNYQFPYQNLYYQDPYQNSNYQFPYQNSYYQYPYQNSYYQYPYQNSYYQYPYQNSYYQNSYCQNPYYQNCNYQNQYYPNLIYYYPPIPQYPPIGSQPTTTTTRPVETTTENNSGQDGERPKDYQNDGESNDLPNDILPENADLSKEITTEAKIF